MDGQTKTSGGMAATAIDGLMEELQVVRSERDKTVQEEKTLRQLVTLLQQEKEVWFIHVVCTALVWCWASCPGLPDPMLHARKFGKATLDYISVIALCSSSCVHYRSSKPIYCGV